VIDAVASDYLDRIRFVAVAGRSDYETSAQRAAELFGPNLSWGFGPDIWDLYGIRGQPASVLIGSDGTVADSWYGALEESELRKRLDSLAKQ
jgi:hypothetical protein